MRSKLGNVFLFIYAIIAITVTFLLLSYNQYMCSEVGGYTLYIVKDESLEPDYVEGDLLLIKQSTDAGVEVDDKILLYQNISSSEFKIKNATLVEKVPQGKRVTYFLEDGYQFDSSYLIGKTENVKVFHHLGTVLSILESRWGYLFCIVIVTLFLFLQELYELFIEIKYGDNLDDDDNEPNQKENVKNVRTKTSTSKNTETRTATPRKSSASKTSTTKATTSKSTTSKSTTSTKRVKGN